MSQTKHKYDAVIQKIAREHTRSIVDLNLIDFREEVEAAMNLRPNNHMIANSLRRLGLEAHGHRWVWKHNKDHE